MDDEHFHDSDNQLESESEDFETEELVVKQIEDAEREVALERDLTEAESRLDRNSRSEDNLDFTAFTLIKLKNFLVKYGKSDSDALPEEVIKIKATLSNFKASPLYYMRCLNNYIFPLLKHKYRFGLDYKTRNPWQNKKIDFSPKKEVSK